MKKSIIIAALACATFMQANAQQTEAPKKANSFTSKNGHEVLPQAGEWAVGFSASSFLNYAGNIFNGTNGNSAATFGNANGPTINTLGNLSGIAFVGKYMKDANTAYRVRFQANSSINTRNNYVLESNLTPNPLLPTYVSDEQKIKNNAFLVGLGIEKRRGATRLQGVYGAEVVLGFVSENRNYSYGNDMNLDFAAPLSTTNFTNGSSALLASRVIEENFGAQFFAGARGFIGAEYFFAPKMSIGAEVGYTLGFQTNGKQSFVNETFDTGTLTKVNVESKSYRNQGLQSFGIGLDNFNAGLNLFLYF
jgi:hypothetical protein